MAKKQQLTGFKKFLIISGSLIIIEGLYLFVFSGNSTPVTTREAITKAVDKQTDLPDQRKDMMRVQLALADYRAKKGSYPKALDELVPDYFDYTPNDPATKQPYKYQIIDGRYVLGDLPVKPQPGEVTNINQKIDPAILATLETDTEKASYVYDPTGKRDPFAPIDFSPKQIDPTGKTPLEMYSVGQLRYTSFLGGFDEPIAMVENNIGRGYPVKKGTKIGPDGGEVVEILPEKIIIVQTTTDFTGTSKTETIELKLRVKEGSDKR